MKSIEELLTELQDMDAYYEMKSVPAHQLASYGHYYLYGETHSNGYMSVELYAFELKKGLEVMVEKLRKGEWAGYKYIGLIV